MMQDDEDEVFRDEAKSADEKTVLTHHVTDTPVDKRKLFHYHLAKTATCVCVWLCVGVMRVTFLTCLLDFEERLHISLDQIGKLLSIMSAMGAVGHMTGATLREYLRVNELLVLSLSTLTYTVACLVTAWSSSTLMLGIGGCLERFSSGVTSTVFHAMIIGLWGDLASSPVHAIHFGWSLGAVIAPLLTRPFLSIPCPSGDVMNIHHDDPVDGNNMTGGQLSSLSEHNQLAKCSLANVTNQTAYNRGSTIEIPLSIPAIPMFIMALLFLSFFIFERTSRGKAWRTVRTDATKTVKWYQYDTSSGISFRFVLLITALVTYFYFIWVGISASLGAFLFTLTVKLPLGFTKDDAAVAYSVYYICFSSARFLAIAIAHYVSIKKMLPIEVWGTLLVMIGWVVFGLNSRELYQFFMCLFGLISSSVEPGGFTWIDQYIVFTAITCAIIELGANVGTALNAWIAGKIIGNYEPQYYLYIVLGLSINSALIMIVLLCLVRKRVDRHVKKSDPLHLDKMKEEVSNNPPIFNDSIYNSDYELLQ